MIKKMIFISAILFLSLNSRADGHGMGNGGDAVVCYKDATHNTIASVEFFDYWEQQQVQIWGAIDLGSAQLSLNDKIKIATQRIAKFDPTLSAFVENNALNIANNIQSYVNNGAPLPNVPDANPAVAPTAPNCFIEQLAIQYKNVQTGQRRFVISDLFFNHPSFSTDSKVGIILHEAIYRYAILKKNETTSDGVRFFNYFIASKVLDGQNPGLNLQDYLQILKTANLENSECRVQNQLIFTDKENPAKICYNQVVRYGTVEMKIPAGTALSWFYYSTSNDFSLGNFFSVPNTTIEVKFIDSYFNAYQFSTSAIRHTFGVLSTSVGTLPNGSAYPLMFGPLQAFYSCRIFELNIRTGEVIKCTTADLPRPFNSFSKGPLPGQWILSGPPENNVAYPIAGSKKGLKLVLRMENWSSSSYDQIVFDQNLNLLNGQIISERQKNTPVMINGVPFYVSQFAVDYKNGVPYLNFRAESNFADPRYKTLRITASDKNDDRKGFEQYCQALGFESGRNLNGYQTEYITAQSDQFYDISTQQVVYKTDEDVDVVKAINCYSRNISTSDY